STQGLVRLAAPAHLVAIHMARLAGKVAAITGAGAGIGRAIALRFAKEGARVAVSDRDGDMAQRTAGEIRILGATAFACVCDVSDETQVQSFLGNAVDELGILDIMANNAAFVRHAPLAQTQTKAWKKSLEVTLDGTFFGTRTALQVMARRGGVILNITS